MDKLEQYIDQVCKSIGGPYDLRQHVRQELREHLLDAVAQHKAAGMTEADAVTKALEEFGKPDEVRTELESAYGQRTMWIVDKAMQWKEMTMRAKWLWTTWAYLALVKVIALEVLFMLFVGVFIIPKFQRLLTDGIIDEVELHDQGVYWMVSVLYDVQEAGRYGWLMILIPPALWALFEWRVRSDNKTFMRLSVLGTAAVGLMLLLVLTAVSVIVPFAVSLPGMGVMARPWAVERIADIDKAISGLEQARTKKDWPAMQEEANKAAGSVGLLAIGPAPTSLAPSNDSIKAEEMRSSVRGMQHNIKIVQGSIANHDEKRLNDALKDFRKALDPVYGTSGLRRPEFLEEQIPANAKKNLP